VGEAADRGGHRLPERRVGQCHSPHCAAPIAPPLPDCTEHGLAGRLARAGSAGDGGQGGRVIAVDAGYQPAGEQARGRRGKCGGVVLAEWGGSENRAGPVQVADCERGPRCPW
jgi:hypothetical protein